MRRLFAGLAAALMLLASAPLRAAPASAGITIRRLPGGLRYGLIGVPGPRPAPAIFILVHDLERMQREPAYSEVGRILRHHGFLAIVLDPPACGEDRRPGEATDLSPWRRRMERGEDFLGAFERNARAVLDALVAAGAVDPSRVAAAGTSKGGFLAFRLAAADPRVRAVAAFAPLTDLMALEEFRGTRQTETAERLSLLAQVPRLRGRPVWVSVGNHDTRIDTDRAIAFTRALVRADARGLGDDAVVPVTLIAGPTAGHVPAVDQAHALAAAWILRQFGMTDQRGTSAASE